MEFPSRDEWGDIFPPEEDRWELEPVVLEYPLSDNPLLRVPEVDEEEE